MLNDGGFGDAGWRLAPRWLSVLMLCVWSLAWSVPAAALEPSEVPEPLRPWLPWVLEQLGDSVCPSVGGGPVCVWPGRLALELDERGGRFRLSVQVDRRARVALPGGDKHWPQDVQVDGRAAVVMAEGDSPVVALDAGQHALEGKFAWQRLPETLMVPARIALLELGVGGQRVAQPKRDGSRVWLKGESAPREEPESLTLEVFRRLEDQVPFSVHTEIVLHVSGRSRELRLPTALTAGSLPIELGAELPARIEPNGELLLQVYPGRHQIQIDALYPTPPERLGAPRHAPPGPAQEIWVFVPHTEIRQVELEGGVSIDPQRTNLPEAWRGGFASYQLEGGSELTFTTLRRGQPQPPPNRVALSRELWLDLDGQGFTVRDHLSGSFERTWRLDLLRGELGHVAVGRVDQLITTAPASGARGVELRDGQLDVDAEWRLEDARSELPAVAWSENVEQLGAELYLPPGWQLLGASGADSVSDSWLSRWDLFALFFVLVIAVAVAKLDRWVWGVLALFALLVAHGEPNAPRFSWAAMLLAIALLQGLPAGRFRKLVRALALLTSLWLLGTSVSFGVSQIRAAMYPQVDDAGGMFELSVPLGASREAQMAPEPAAMPAPMPAGAPMEQAAEMDRKEGGMGFGRAGGGLSSSAIGDTANYAAPKKTARNTLLEQDPNAQIQTGPGVPSWRWRAWHLGWSGPVEHTHTLDLYLLSPGVNALLSALRIALVGLFTFWGLRQVWRRSRPSAPGAAMPGRASPRSAAPAAAVLGLALVASLCWARAARADMPTPELLEQLKARMQPPRACEDGACVDVSALAIEVRDNEVRLEAEVHVAERAAYQLPGPVSRWLPASVEVDGRAASALLLGDDDYLHVRLDPGRHRVRARGPIAGRQLSLDPGTPPHWVTLDAPGWEVSGLSESGQIDGSLGLVRPLPVDGSRGPAAEDAPTTLPTWARVTRTFSFGVSWTLRTELERVSPKGSLIVARVPLLQGERVTSADVSVEAGIATLRLTGDGDIVGFDSVLEPRPSLELTAATNAGYSERWVVRCSPIYRCDAASGIAPIQHREGNRWEPAFAPWPGEKLTLGVVRPAAATGQTATVDSARLELHPGVRSLRAELTAHLRLSMQTRYELGLPEGSEVDRLSIDSNNEPIRQTGSTLELVLAPGEHELSVGWQAPDGMRAWFVTPEVRFGAELINAEVSVHVPDERWLLAAGGPGWGPAILFWGHLVLILLLAPLLGRMPRSPLRAWEWALLGIGLTQVPLVVAGSVFGWFFVVAFQDVNRPESPFWFNLRQLVLIVFTLVFLGCLFGAVYDSLLNTPNMEVAGSGSSERLLHWYVDRTAGALPVAWVLNLSLWVWRSVMLLWALWLAHHLVRWLGWAWQKFSAAGVWKPKRPAPAATKS
ncbi:MAG TPA: hypothetical protein VMG12_34465 [Polyangiaceae bacterium]|nr:hypothetical protein [Polyangiaceae bacterium]